MTNFDFLLADLQFTTFGEVAVAAERAQLFFLDKLFCDVNDLIFKAAGTIRIGKCFDQIQRVHKYRSSLCIHFLPKWEIKQCCKRHFVKSNVNAYYLLQTV